MMLGKCLSPGTTACRCSMPHLPWLEHAYNHCLGGVVPLRSKIRSLRPVILGLWCRGGLCGVRVILVGLLSPRFGLCPPSTLAQQVGLTVGCHKGAGNPAAGLRFHVPGVQVLQERHCGPSREEGKCSSPLCTH